LIKAFLIGNFDGGGTISVIDLPVLRIELHLCSVFDRVPISADTTSVQCWESDPPIQQGDPNHHPILTTGSISMEGVAIARLVKSLPVPEINTVRLAEHSAGRDDRVSNIRNAAVGRNQRVGWALLPVQVCDGQECPSYKIRASKKKLNFCSPERFHKTWSGGLFAAVTETSRHLMTCVTMNAR
jgi:hypothetical protein